MTGVIIVFVLLWFALMVFLFVGTTWFQGYIYSEPADGLFWRAPAAGTVLVLIVLFWGYLDYKSPGTYPALFDFSPSEEHEPFKELWGVKGGTSVRYKREKSATGQVEYRDDNKRPLPSHPEAIIVKEDGEEVRFEPERDAQGNFKKAPGQSLKYIDPRGRVMTEDAMGQLSTFRRGLFLGYALLNLIHLAGWFACLWLILRFQWPHALGLAVVCWLVMSLLIMPMLLKRMEDAARQRTVVPSESASQWQDQRSGVFAFGAN